MGIPLLGYLALSGWGEANFAEFLFTVSWAHKDKAEAGPTEPRLLAD